MDAPAPSQSITLQELHTFKNDLDLTSEGLCAVAGLNPQKYRRGRYRDPLLLDADVSSRLTRCRRALAIALEVSGGDWDAAMPWLHENSPALANKSPFQLAFTEVGIAEVETFAARLRTLTSRSPFQLALAGAGIAEVETFVAKPHTSSVPRVVTSEPAKAVQPTAPGIDTTKKHRIAEALKIALSKNAKLTRAEVARRMQAAGHCKFTGATLHRYWIGYEASWSEIKDLAEILGETPVWLVETTRAAKHRIAEALKIALSRNAKLTRAEVARRMQAAGHCKFTGSTLHRYSIGYEASWSEIKDLAEILRKTPVWLVETTRAAMPT